MNTRLFHGTILSGVILITTGLGAQEAKPAEPPVEFPKLEKFEPLWKRSIFTTKDLPSPDAPTGPNFADNLSLSGIYEIDGTVVAVLVDRVTSQVMEARIGSENEMGIKIRSGDAGSQRGQDAHPIAEGRSGRLGQLCRSGRGAAFGSRPARGHSHSSACRRSPQAAGHEPSVADHSQSHSSPSSSSFQKRCAAAAALSGC
jgi:hypothetical protein